MWQNITYIKEIITSSKNKTDVLKKLNLPSNGGNYNTLTTFINENDIDISHFKVKITNKNNHYVDYSNIEDFLIENSKYKSTNHLKNRLYKEGLKHRNCEICGQGEDWKGKKMSLILDHINGINNDNRLENLRIVCPNCNATLDTHCRGSRKKSTYSKHDECSCGSEKLKRSETCVKCYMRNRKSTIKSVSKSSYKESMFQRRKVERPSYEQLLKELEESNWTQVGNKYGVSDNAVRKWVRMYEKHGVDY
jgi:hypothetical protein